MLIPAVVVTQPIVVAQRVMCQAQGSEEGEAAWRACATLRAGSRWKYVDSIFLHTLIYFELLQHYTYCTWALFLVAK